MSEPLLSVLLKQGFIVILCVAMMTVMFRYMKGQIRYYQKRNETLSELLAASEVRHSEELLSTTQRHSEELLSATQRHCKEREQMRTELLLQCDSMSRNTLAFLKEGLLASLQTSDGNSEGG